MHCKLGAKYICYLMQWNICNDYLLYFIYDIVYVNIMMILKSYDFLM